MRQSESYSCFHSKSTSARVKVNIRTSKSTSEPVRFMLAQAVRFWLTSFLGVPLSVVHPCLHGTVRHCQCYFVPVPDPTLLDEKAAVRMYEVSGKCICKKSTRRQDVFQRGSFSNSGLV